MSRPTWYPSSVDLEATVIDLVVELRTFRAIDAQGVDVLPEDVAQGTIPTRAEVPHPEDGGVGKFYTSQRALESTFSPE